MKNSLIFQKLAISLLLGFLAACSMPDAPDGANLDGMTHLGNQLRSRGDDGGAADFYQRALQRNPADKDARKGLAEILENHGDNINASQQYAEAIRLDPENGELRRALGRVFIKLGQPENAKDQFDHALRIDPDDTKALNGLGITLDYLGNHIAAQKAYKEALDEKPDDLTTINNLAHSYVLVGSYEEAIKLLEPHVNEKGVTPAFRQNLAEAYGMAGMLADAERMGRMDLKPEQLKQNLATYKANRDKLSLVPKLYADLGSFPTSTMAELRAEDVKTRFAKETEGLLVNTKSEVKTIGSTPVFSVTITGFARAEKLRTLCDRLKKEDIACKAHGI